MDQASRSAIVAARQRSIEFAWVIVAILMVANTGCGPNRAATSPVTGTVTYRGMPVANAQVQFFPPKSRPAAGATDADGRFKLLTWASGDGAVIGEHIVCITKFEINQSVKPGSANSQMLGHLPARYATPTISELRANVTATGPNEFQFDLKDAP